MTTGVRRPGMSLGISIAMVVCGAVAVAWGWATMNALGRETTATAAVIGLGLFGLLLGLPLSFNFLWAVRKFRAIARGEGLIARWTVAPATFEMWRDADRALAARGDRNDYSPPKQTPPAGLEVIVTADAMMVGGAFFGLASTGMVRFEAVRWRPGVVPSLEFDTVHSTYERRRGLRHQYGRLRVPVAHNGRDDARRALAHYEAVLARRTVVNPGFWRRRLVGGLWVAGLGAAAAVTGFVLEAREMGGIAPLLLAVAGTIVGLAVAVVALITGVLHAKQHRG